jgi:DNA polymerase-3 subunit delta
MKSPKHLILICGDEEYLKEQKKKELLDALVTPGSLNYNAFADDAIDPDEIGKLAATLPFFEDHRTILVSGSGWMHGPVEEQIIELFTDVPETTYIILYEKEADNGSKLVKLFKEKGEIFRYTSADAKKGKDAASAKTDIRNWVRDYLKKEGRNIDSRVLNDLCELTGYDMQNLSTELEKLICYTLDRPNGSKIMPADIDSIVSRTLSDRVFEMMGHKLAGRNAKAVGMLEEIFALKNPPMRVLYIIVRQYNQAYQLKELQRQGLSDAQCAAKMQVQDWLVRRLNDQTRNTSLHELRKGLELCAEMETKVKNGDMPDRLAVEIIMAS